MKKKKQQTDAEPELKLPEGSDFLDHTIQVWQPYADKKLTREDARQIKENIVGFFETLIRMEEKSERRNDEGS